MSMNTHQIANANGAKTAEAAAPTKEEQKAKAKTATDIVAEKLEGHLDKIAMQLGKTIDPQKFMASCINAIARDPNLIRALSESPRTVVGAVYQAAECGFEPNTSLGNCYIIPRYAKDKVASEKAGRDVYKWQATFQHGYKGVKELAYRSGQIDYLDAMEVYEKDEFDYMLGTTRYLKHKPYDGENPGKVVKYYAICKLKGSNEPLFKVWSADKVMGHAKRKSSSYNDKYKRFYGPWDTDFESMAKKTVLLDVLNLAPKSLQFAAQIAADSSVKSIPLEGSGAVSMLLQPNEVYETEDALAAPPETALLPGGEEGNGPTGESVEKLKERLNLATGADLKPRQKAANLNPEDVI